MSFKTNTTRALGYIRGLFPEQLPQGVTAFNAFCDSIVSIYKPAMSDRDVKFVVATLIQRFDPTTSTKSKYYFYKCLQRGAAGQIAAHAMYTIKQEQAAEEAAAKLAAASAPTAADVSN